MIKNLNGALEPLRLLQRGVLDAKKAAETTVAKRIVATAASRAPGSLGAAIHEIQTDNETKIIAGAEIAAYVEFGTGGPLTGGDAEEYIATLPLEWQELAHEFFAGGKGSGKKQPFFYPAVIEHRDELIPELEKELQNITK